MLDSENVASIISSREWQILLILLALGGFLFLENTQKKTFAGKARRVSYVTNLCTFVMNDTVMSFLSVSSLLLIASDYAQFGLLAYVPGPFWKVVVSFLSYDLTLYLWHRACHSKYALWKLHRVHHSDLSVNATTAFRLHAGEVVLTTLVKAVCILVTGMSVPEVFLNETIITLFVIFHHSDISFVGEKWLCHIVIVPKLHRVHHSVAREEQGRNFGAVLTIWDRMFGTFKKSVPKKYGVSGVGVMDPIRLLLYGFKK